MAMTAFELFGVLKLDRTEFDRGLNDAEKRSLSFGSMLGGGLARAAKIGAVAISGATTAVVGFGKSSINAATSYESAFTGVRKTVDATEEEFGQLSNWIMESSTKMASSKEQIAATMEIAGQLGVEGVEGLEKFTETMIMLGDTTNLNSEEAAGALARFGNIAGVGAEDMDKIGSVIVDLGNNFATTESDIVNMSTRLASAGTVAGLSATDILALSTAMSSVGIQAEAGGTAMAQTLASMTKAVEHGAEDMGRSLDELKEDNFGDLTAIEQFALVSGMTAQQFADAWKGDPIQAISAFIGGLDDLNEADESVIMTLEDMGLKGIRQTNMLQALALASDMMGNAVDTANTAFEENVALQNEAATRYGTTESAALQAAEAFSNLKVKLGEELMPTYQEFLGFSQTAMNSLASGLDEGGIDGMMSALGTALSDGLNEIGGKIPDAFNAGGQLLGALAQGIMENIPQIVDGAVQVGVQFMQGLVEALPEIATGAVTLIQSLGESLSNNSEALLQIGADLLQMLLTGITEGIPALFDGAVSIVTGLATFIAENIPQLIPALVQAVGEMAQALTDPSTLTTIVQAAIQIVLALAQGILNAIPELLRQAPIIISNLVGAIVAALPQILSAGVQIIVMLITGIVSAIPDLIALIPRLILALVGGLVQGVVAIAETGKQLVAGFVQGIKNAWDGAVTTVVTFFTGFIDRVKALFGVHSPSTVFSDIGNNLIQGLIDGISNMMSNLREKAEEILGTFKELPEKIIDIGTNIVEGLWEGISGSISWIKDKITGWVGDVFSFMKSLFGINSPSTLMRDMIGLNLGKGVAVGIENSLPFVSDALDDMSSLVEAPNIAIAGTSNNGFTSSRSVLSAMENEQRSTRNVTIILELEKTQLAKTVYALNNEETQRVGLNLAGGYA